MFDRVAKQIPARKQHSSHPAFTQPNRRLKTQDVKSSLGTERECPISLKILLAFNSTFGRIEDHSPKRRAKAQRKGYLYARIKTRHPHLPQLQWKRNAPSSSYVPQPRDPRQLPKLREKDRNFFLVSDLYSSLFRGPLFR